MAKVTRQIRIEPMLEDAIQEVAERESRSFSGTCNWLLGLVTKKYLNSKNDFYHEMNS